MISCGHDTKLNDDVKIGSTKIGKVVYKNYGLFESKRYDDITGGYLTLLASYGDFSIITLDSNSGYSPTSYVNSNNGLTKISGSANVVTGLDIKYYGATTKYGYGTVIGTNQVRRMSVPSNDPLSSSNSDVWVMGLIRVTPAINTTQGGDSGGAAWVTTSAGRNCIIGCITGKITSDYSNDVLISPSNLFEDYGFVFENEY